MKWTTERKLTGNEEGFTKIHNYPELQFINVGVFQLKDGSMIIRQVQPDDVFNARYDIYCEEELKAIVKTKLEAILIISTQVFEQKLKGVDIMFENVRGASGILA